MDLKESKKTSELIFDGEILHVYKDTAMQCIKGEITDGKTIAGILKAFYMVNGF